MFIFFHANKPIPVFQVQQWKTVCPRSLFTITKSKSRPAARKWTVVGDLTQNDRISVFPEPVDIDGDGRGSC